MTLSAGTRLGPYEIVEPIGAGGMGEVYRAKDPRLRREVAIKVLPASYSGDTDRLKRFEQEARAAGILSHPNITSVLDVGTSDGAPYVVQELLEGETLRAALAAGRLSPRTAIDYAIQIAQGLAAAHEKHIVHRDLKPENVFVTRDGRVKILDFGLAKLTQEEESSGATDVATATGPGVVMGTLGYLSPEQIKAKPADARSDIFAFGAILYEMLSGHRAFRGDSAGETMAAILREDPPDLSATNQSITPGLDRIVRHCLEKNPERRFQSASDVAFDLETLSSVTAPREVPSRGAARWRRPALVALAVVAIAAAGLLAGRWIWRTPAAPVPTYHRLTYRRGWLRSGRFAPNGQSVVYTANWSGSDTPQLFTTTVDNPGSLPLDLPAGLVLSISPAGEMLLLEDRLFSAGYTHRGILRMAPLAGGAARDLAEDVVDADWSPDGKSMALVRAPGWKHRLEFPVGKVLFETGGWISHPRVSQRGDAVAFLDHPQFGDDAGGVAIIDRDGRKKTLADGFSSAQGLAWSPSGDEIWFTATEAGGSRGLHAVSLSGRRRVLSRSPGNLTLYDVSRDGRVLIAHTTERLGLGLYGDGGLRDLSWLDWSRGGMLTSDGRTMVFTEEGEGGGPGYSVYLRKTDGSAAVRLGEGEGIALSHDGKWVLIAVVARKPVTLAILPTGIGEPRHLPSDGIDHDSLPASFSPDGRRIVFTGSEAGRGRRVWVQDLAGGKAKPVTPEGVVGWVLSPDGRLVVARDPAGKLGLYPLEGGSPAPLDDFEPQDLPIGWSDDQRYLFVTQDSPTGRIFRYDLRGRRREVWREFSLRDQTGINRIRVSSITPDGKTLAFSYGQRISDLYVVDGVR